MQKFSFGSYTSSGEIVYSADKGYSNPTDETGTRRQLSFPLGELKTFINKTVTVKGENAVQLRVTDYGLQYTLNGTTWNDVVVRQNAYSFVGMVVSGVNLETEADVQEQYGADTHWTKLSSVILASEHVFGNGYALGLTSGSNDDPKRYGLKYSTSTTSKLITGASAYGSELNSSSSTGAYNPTNSECIGVITKARIESDVTTVPPNKYEYSGLVADTETVYTWKRTA